MKTGTNWPKIHSGIALVAFLNLTSEMKHKAGCQNLHWKTHSGEQNMFYDLSYFSLGA